MGAGIAQVFAQTGYPVVLMDAQPEALDRAAAGIEKSLGRLVKKGTLGQEQIPVILERIARTTKHEGLRECQMVIEAVVESAAVKSEVLTKLDEVTSPACILATNTSSISITELAAVTQRPDKVIGMHFMNPVPVMTLVELIRGLATSDETYGEVESVTRELEKTPVEVSDYPGFVSNRILMPMINEAFFCLMEGVASREDIDSVSGPMG